MIDNRHINVLCEMLSEEEQQLLQQNIRLLKFEKNFTIFQEGDMPKDLMCISKGKVKIFKSGVGGRSQIIRIIRTGSFFGYQAYFAGDAHVTSASTIEDCVIYAIPLKLLSTILEDNGKLALMFIRALSLDLEIADQRIVNLTQKHLRGRLAESLLMLKDSYGLEEDGATINIYLAREDLANLSNMTTANAIRTLSSFEKERVIAVDGRRIKIIDEEKLLNISRIG